MIEHQDCDKNEMSNYVVPKVVCVQNDGY